MSLTESWGWTNGAASTETATVAQVGEYSNYGKKQDDPNVCIITNKTSPIDQPETIAYKARAEKVNVTSLAYPPRTRDGVYFSTQVRGIKRVTQEDGTITDYPMECTLSFKLSSGFNWSNADFLTMLARTLGADFNETSSAWRFKDLTRMALAPTQD